MARWSIQTITFWAARPVGLTETGRSWASSTTSEQVASKPIPAMAAGLVFAAFSAARTARPQAAQMSSDECSAKSGAGRQSLIGWVAWPSMRPVAVNTPARALPVPTSMPRNRFGVMGEG